MSSNEYYIFCCIAPFIIAIVATIITVLVVKKNNRNRLKTQQVEYSNKYKQWLEQGFDLKTLDMELNNSVNLSENIRKFKEFEEKLVKLKTLTDEVNKLDIDLNAYQDLGILLKQPDKLKKIEDYIAKIKDQRINDVKTQRMEVKNLSEDLRRKNKELFEKATHDSSESLLNVSTVLSLEIDKLIDSYQLGDIEYEEIASEFKKMIKQTEILLSEHKGKQQSYSNIRENVYEILRVKPNATFEEVKYMRNALVKIFLNNSEEMKKINDAYDILSDPEKRNKYNLENHIEGI